MKIALSPIKTVYDESFEVGIEFHGGEKQPTVTFTQGPGYGLYNYYAATVLESVARGGGLHVASGWLDGPVWTFSPETMRGVAAEIRRVTPAPAGEFEVVWKTRPADWHSLPF